MTGERSPEMTSPPIPERIDPATPSARVLTVGLGFTAGFVDTLAFVALFAFFTAHVTGNFVVLGSALSQPVHGLTAKLLALPVFIASVAGARLYGRRLEQRGQAAAWRLLLAQAVFLAAFMGLGFAASPIIDADAPIAILTALSGSVAMGIQNAASRTVFANLSPTTVMTGNITQLVIDAVDLLCGGPEATRKLARARFRNFWPPVVAFAYGAACGAYLFTVHGFLCILLPIVVVAGLAIFVRSRSTLPI